MSLATMMPLRRAVAMHMARQRMVMVTPRMVSSHAAASASPSTSGSKPSWQIRMLYDGECPLCMREVNFLRSKDGGRGLVDFVDIASPAYSPADNAGITYQQAMERIHAIEADGRVVTNIEVFRRVYEVIGLGWVYAITSNPTVEKLANAVYGVWAKYRMEVTGREAMAIIIERQRAAAAAGGRVAGSACADADAACELPASSSSSSRAAGKQ
uniref:Thiol-disulfide oxidoreductase DCC n=1 Tax=Chlamydomonas leiostraca TaxID=1034604 RepID=A0A7S0WLG8_9CHLO